MHGQRRYVEAIETYEAGIKLEDSPALRKGYEEVKAAKGTFVSFRFVSKPLTSLTNWYWTCVAADERGDGADVMGIGKMFSDPNLFSKLAANPRTAKLLADASFMQKACIIIPLSPPLPVRCSPHA